MNFNYATQECNPRVDELSNKKFLQKAQYNLNKYSKKLITINLTKLEFKRSKEERNKHRLLYSSANLPTSTSPSKSCLRISLSKTLKASSL